jgi:hypothetical protein
VKELIGPRVLLYGMSVWKGKNEYEALHRFHRDAAGASGCQKSINFVSGANVQLISQSHRVPERLAQALLRSLSLIEEESLKLPNREQQLAFLENVSQGFSFLPSIDVTRRFFRHVHALSLYPSLCTTWYALATALLEPN